MENIQLSSKNNLSTGNIQQNNDTWINILDATEFLNKVLKMIMFQLFCPTPVYCLNSEGSFGKICDGILINKKIKILIKFV